MKSEQPAEGILKRSDFGDTKFYQVVCGCGQEYHDHNLEVEAADTGVSVNIYATAKTDYWSETFKKRFDIDSIWQQEFDWFWKDLLNGLITKIKVTWQLWTTGAVRVETTIAMTEQQALNYAETLKSAIKDVKMFRQAGKEKSSASKLAEQGDCI